MTDSRIAVNVATGPTITLVSGRLFDLFDPAGSDFEIEDIAHGLAHVCRYAGQCRGFYSVAEHSMLVADVVPPEAALEALMHDAAEAFIGDVTRPLKTLLPHYKVIEASVEAAIRSRFSLPNDHLGAVKFADLSVLAAEQQQVMPAGTADWAALAGIVPAPVVVKLLNPEQAKSRFLDYFERLIRPQN